MNEGEIYGRGFAAVYDDHWGGFARAVWPLLLKTVKSSDASAKTWLDLCCGSGVLLGLASKAGFTAVGVDRSSHQLEYARRNAPLARFVLMDIKRLRMPGSFDVITCMYDSLNYVLRGPELRRIFSSVARLLAPGGVFIFDVNTVFAFRRQWSGTTWAIREPRRIVMLESAHRPGTDFAQLRLTGFTRRGSSYERFEEIHRQRSYSRSTMADMLHCAGLRFACYRRRRGIFLPPMPDSSRLFYVCRHRSSRGG